MSKLIFWILLILLVIFALRSKAKSVQRKAAPPEAAPSSRPQARGEIEDMTACAHCGIYFPASEAVKQDGQDYCSQAHARLPAK